MSNLVQGWEPKSINSLNSYINKIRLKCSNELNIDEKKAVPIIGNFTQTSRSYIHMKINYYDSFYPREARVCENIRKICFCFKSPSPPPSSTMTLFSSILGILLNREKCVRFSIKKLCVRGIYFLENCFFPPEVGNVFKRFYSLNWGK